MCVPDFNLDTHNLSYDTDKKFGRATPLVWRQHIQFEYFLNYLKENENSFEVFSMLADAEIFPHEYSQFSTNQESNIKDSAYFLIAVMKDLLLNVEITGYYFQSDSDNGKKSPTQAALTEHINSMSIKNLSTRNINGIFSEANRLLKDAMKE